MTLHLRNLILLLLFSTCAFGQNTDGKKQNIDNAGKRYKIGVCDWMVLKRQKLGEFKLARQIEADGVEMDMGGLGKRDSFDNKLRKPADVAEFKHHADSFSVEVGAMAMSGFYGQSLIDKKTYKWLAEDCLNTMKQFNVQVAFLPLGGTGNDWFSDPAKRKEVVKRLRTIGNMAAKQKKVFGIDTPLSAEDNLKLLAEIKSQGIKIFYKWQTAIENGRDIPSEIRTLGNNICAFHSSNTDSVWIQNDPKIDVDAIKAAMDEIGWTGWMFVERSRDVSDVKNVKKNYGANVRYLKKVFQPEYVKLNSDGLDEKYVETILGRSQKAVDALNLKDEVDRKNVLNIISNRYFELNKIYEDRDSLKKDKSKRELAEALCNAQLYKTHEDFLSKLAMHITPEQITTVKDVMTFNSVKVQCDALYDMIPTLTEQEKQQVRVWYEEAREYAIDAESSKKKHEWFGKYKGRINNWLSSRGYDLVKERELWYKRIEERKAKEAKK